MHTGSGRNDHDKSPGSLIRVRNLDKVRRGRLGCISRSLWPRVKTGSWRPCEDGSWRTFTPPGRHRPLLWTRAAPKPLRTWFTTTTDKCLSSSPQAYLQWQEIDEQVQPHEEKTARQGQQWYNQSQDTWPSFPHQEQIKQGKWAVLDQKA